MKCMFCEDPENEEQAVAAIRNDRVRKNGMSGLRTAMTACQAADTQPYFYWMTVNEFNQCATIVSMDMQFASVSTVRAGLHACLHMLHVFIENGFSRPFFVN